MKIVQFLLILLPLTLTSQVWQNSASFPGSGRHHPITFSNDQFGYVISGSNLDDVFKYNKISDTWSQLPNIPFSARGYSYGVSIGNIAFMGFGIDLNNNYPTDWWQFDMLTETWTQLANFPGDGRAHPAMVVANENIYVGCGSNGSNLGDWWEYNVINDSWSQKSSIIGNDRHHPFYFGIDEFAYVGFGHGSLPGPGSNQTGAYIYNDFYRYDPTNDSWIQLIDFPSEARVAGTQFSFNGNGYILSGDGDNHGPLDSGEMWEYNPLTDTWSQLLSHPGDAIWAPGNFVIGCDVYFLLGQNNVANPSTFTNNVYKYKLSEDCGCTDNLAFNFSSVAISDDGSCCYISGCTDPYALNYDSTSCFDDGTCISPILGCINPFSNNYDSIANTNVAFGGALDNSFGSGNYFTGNQHLIFDSYKECVIKSAVIYAQSNNTITFELRDNNAVVIDDTTLNVVTGEQTINLNFEVPIGSNFELGISSNNSGLFRNNSNVDYPYDIASALTITSSSANTSPNDYYYFYYNLEVEAVCDDATITSWDCNPDGDCFDPGDGTGEYSLLSECESECVNVSINENTISDFVFYPNPVKDQISIEFSSNVIQSFDVKIFDFIGREIYFEYLNNFNGNYKRKVNLSNYKMGIYFIQISSDEGVLNRKFIIG
jgi:N-acetylneuraminic acid mutarotase